MRINEMEVLKVTVDKAELIANMEANRDKHREIYLTAMEGYRSAAVNWLEDRINAAKAGRDFGPLVFREPMPEDHTEDYDRVLRMLQMDKNDELEIEEERFAQYVMDDWGWKKQWSQTVSNYTIGAS